MPITLRPDGDWREFDLASGERAAYEIVRTLYSGQTQYQHVEIAETRPYGLALFLDGLPQSAVADEFVYHEALVHPALLAHPEPRRVMIAGGGEGATLREVLRHPSVERATMVDIDGELLDLVRQYLAPIHQGALDDPRADVVVGDALAHLREHEDRYDAIVIDLTDPDESGPIAELYTEDFYRLAASRLNDGGVLVTQAYSFALNNLGWYTRIARTLAGVFPLVRPYRAEVPFFKDSWGLCTASFVRDPAALPDLAIDRLLEQRGLSDLRYYDGTTHTSMFALPRYARAALRR
ncbi:MAG: polyamine aminopropyltransferase [Chloroflexota bacterium]|nr:polyamine aminopropyltransferase [Chloroflexota bacterium]